VGTGVLAVLLLACAGTAAGATWVVDDDGGAGMSGCRRGERDRARPPGYA